MAKKVPGKDKLVAWNKHCHKDHLGADMFETGFPLLYGISISISTFPEKSILNIGEVLKEERQRNTYFACVDEGNHRRVYAIPNSKANAKLALQCCFEGDCVDWDANQAYFKDGSLVAVVSNFSLTDIPNGHGLVKLQEDIYHDSRTLKDIYKQEIDRVARKVMGYKESRNPFVEMLQILKADSPRGKGLHDSYRDAVRDIL